MRMTIILIFLLLAPSVSDGLPSSASNQLTGSALLLRVVVGRMWVDLVKNNLYRWDMDVARASLYELQSLIPRDTRYAQTLGSPFLSFYDLLMPQVGCGATVDAKDSYQTLEINVGDKRYGDQDREDFMRCNYWIKAPEGSIIEVQIVRITNGLANDGCVYAGVEIKTHADLRLTGYRFCADEDAGVTLRSNYHIVPVMAYNRLYETEIVLKYRIVPGGRPMPTTPPTYTIESESGSGPDSGSGSGPGTDSDSEPKCKDDKK
ncbi:hypothetical protein NECAME_12998 [Necator americanus]|uniref:CUB domain-containing protein n=1 Tax=Necator americanus TaxID=51031 RepID=W2T0D0_NECAM|nr:hypothetical protein NECAME_12998 [Necator americanus]ETN74422.1 hypothetical protein NECAME_12998 [Necator americanus]